MADMDDDDTIILACATVILTSTVLLHKNLTGKKRRHSVWVRGYLKQREEFGCYNRLLKDLRIHDKDKLRNYLRMEPSTFEELFTKVEPLITVRSTRFR
jgi:hypothetical protein